MKNAHVMDAIDNYLNSYKGAQINVTLRKIWLGSV